MCTGSGANSKGDIFIRSTYSFEQIFRHSSSPVVSKHKKVISCSPPQKIRSTASFLFLKVEVSQFYPCLKIKFRGSVQWIVGPVGDCNWKVEIFVLFKTLRAAFLGANRNFSGHKYLPGSSKGCQMGGKGCH